MAIDPEIDLSAGNVSVPGPGGAPAGGTHLGPDIVDPSALTSRERQEAAARENRRRAGLSKNAGQVRRPKGKQAKEWREMRARTLLECARHYEAQGTIAAGLEFLRQVWQEGLMTHQEWDQEARVFKEVIVHVKDQRLRVEALEKWMDRLLGKPVQQIEKEGGNDPAIRNLTLVLQRFEGIARDRNAALESIITVGAEARQADAADARARLPGQQVH